MKFDIVSCVDEASYDCQWGSDALVSQIASLCPIHSAALYESPNGLLKTGQSHFRIDRPGVIKGVTDDLGK